MTRELVIDGHTINDESDCFVIAEVGHNHQGDMEKARELFRQARDCGATAVKLQKRDNKSLYRRSMYDQPYDNENSFGPTYGQHREALEFGWTQYRELQDYARELGLTFFATAFDLPSADFLQELGVPVFKIASGDLRNIPLITHVASFSKPLIVSCGGGTLDDVRRVYDAVMPINRQLALLQCTCSYPCEFSELDLGVITTFRKAFPDVVVGYSGHDSGIAMAVAAYVLGARIIEKHFTLNRAMKGTDHAFSLEPVGMKKMARDLKRLRAAIGDGTKKVHPSEAPAVRKMGKALVAARDLPAGHVLADGDVAIKSPADGLPPFELPRVLGRRLKQPVRADDFIVLDALG
jgi:sialic acid synthase